MCIRDSPRVVAVAHALGRKQLDCFGQVAVRYELQGTIERARALVRVGLRLAWLLCGSVLLPPVHQRNKVALAERREARTERAISTPAASWWHTQKQLWKDEHELERTITRGYVLPCVEHPLV